MKTMGFPLLLILLLVCISTARCVALPTSGAQQPDPTETAILPTQTWTNTPATPELTPISPLTLKSVNKFAPLPVEKVIAQEVRQPVGVASVIPGHSEIALYDRTGRLVGEVSTPTGGPLPPIFAHIAGPSHVKNAPPVIYVQIAEDNSASLWVAENNQNRKLADMEGMVMGLVGLPGQATIAYTTLHPEAGDKELTSRLYLSDLTSAQPADPVLMVKDLDGRTIIPVAVRSEGSRPVGIWYTRRPWGIGGEMLFEPNEGLYYLDLAEGRVYEALPTSAAFSNLSPDQLWAAYSLYEENTWNLYLRNLATGETIPLPRLPENWRGAGAGVISSENQYLAWLEGRGWSGKDTFQITIRGATLEGKIMAEFQGETIAQVVGWEDATSYRPVGWLDSQTLLVELRGSDKGSAAVAWINVLTRQMGTQAPGKFVGLLYAE